MTTAARSRDYYRKHQMVSEVVEHRRGPWRTDLLGLWDVIAFDEIGKCVRVCQSYLNTKANRTSHAARFKERAATLDYLRRSGVRMETHAWRKRKGRWTVEVVSL